VADFSILIAEDLEEDVHILKRAFSLAGVDIPLYFVENGKQAIEYLKGAGIFQDRRQNPLPAMLLLDLKMPLLNGFEVLEWLRGQPGLRRLPVVVFTCSNRPDDVDRAYELGANSYIVKPTDFNALQETARHLQNYWLKLNLRPSCGATGEGQGDRVIANGVSSAKNLS
jgi:CheY-like chemotaxis protein